MLINNLLEWCKDNLSSHFKNTNKMLLLRDEFIISRFPPCICPLAKAGGPGREGGVRPQRRRRPGDLRNHRAPSRGRGHDYLLISAAERRVSVELLTGSGHGVLCWLCVVSVTPCLHCPARSWTRPHTHTQNDSNCCGTMTCSKCYCAISS